MTDHTSALVERLSAATVGSRELDGAVWYAVFEPDVEHGCLHVEQTEQGPREALTCELGSKWADDVGSYTTSLDAALALAERVLDGKTALHLLADLLAHEAAASDFDLIAVADVARLLCIAILKAVPTNTAGEETPSTSETEERG